MVSGRIHHGGMMQERHAPVKAQILPVRGRKGVKKGSKKGPVSETVGMGSVKDAAWPDRLGCREHRTMDCSGTFGSATVSAAPIPSLSRVRCAWSIFTQNVERIKVRLVWCPPWQGGFKRRGAGFVTGLNATTWLRSKPIGNRRSAIAAQRVSVLLNPPCLRGLAPFMGVSRRRSEKATVSNGFRKPTRISAPRPKPLKTVITPSPRRPPP